MKIIEGTFQTGQGRFALVVARFNAFIVDHLQHAAVDTLIRHGVGTDQIDIIKTPGSFEIPLVAQKLAHSGRYDAIICLGAIIRGSTPHFDYVAAETAAGIARAAQQTGLPVIFGVLTTDTIEQAIERAGTKAGNKGTDAAMTAIEMVDLLKKI